MHWELPVHAVFKRKGPRAWFKRWKCWWRGGHDWDGKLKQPYPYRPKICKQCGAEWRYIKADCPPPLGQVTLECPHCYMRTWHDPRRTTCTCFKCGWTFSASLREQTTCEHCGRPADVGDSCPGCGAST